MTSCHLHAGTRPNSRKIRSGLQADFRVRVPAACAECVHVTPHTELISSTDVSTPVCRGTLSAPMTASSTQAAQGRGDRPVIAGEVAFTTPRIAGWAKGERFHPEPSGTTQLEVEQGYAAAGSTVVHLPRDWAAYQGLYTSGKRIVLSYSVGKTAVFESPWYGET